MLEIGRLTASRHTNRVLLSLKRKNIKNNSDTKNNKKSKKSNNNRQQQQQNQERQRQ
jgi:hypothetical protein